MDWIFLYNNLPYEVLEEIHKLAKERDLTFVSALNPSEINNTYYNMSIVIPSIDLENMMEVIEEVYNRKELFDRFYERLDEYQRDPDKLFTTEYLKVAEKNLDKNPILLQYVIENHIQGVIAHGTRIALRKYKDNYLYLYERSRLDDKLVSIGKQEIRKEVHKYEQ